MRWLQTLLQLRAPLAALALCALVAQQMVGFVLTASPALALESGFSLCLSGPPPAEDDPKDTISGAGFCPCTLQGAFALVPPSSPEVDGPLLSSAVKVFIPRASLLTDGPPTGPPPARAPPATLHS